MYQGLKLQYVRTGLLLKSDKEIRAFHHNNNQLPGQRTWGSAGVWKPVQNYTWKWPVGSHFDIIPSFYYSLNVCVWSVQYAGIQCIQPVSVVDYFHFFHNHFWPQWIKPCRADLLFQYQLYCTKLSRTSDGPTPEFGQDISLLNSCAGNLRERRF